MQSANRSLPRDYATLAAAPPPGMFVSPNVLDPVLFLSRSGGRYTARLGAQRSRKGVREQLMAPGLDYGWVAGEGIIHPLPHDAGSIVEACLTGVDPEDLSFPQVLALQRNLPDRLPAIIDPLILTSASDLAEEASGPDGIPGLQATLYGYQTKGVAWMDHALAHTGGVILADEMGLGKTIQIIALLLLHPLTADAPALILCPTTLIANWVREIGRFAPSLDIMVHRGPDRARLHRDLTTRQVVISTYDTLVNDLVLFKAVGWSFVICDEAQALKNPDSQRRQAVAELVRRRTIPVTGTPVENTLLDLWSLADVAIPGLLGDRDWFEMHFPDTEDAAKALADITNPVVLRRQVRDVAQDLPERLDIEVPVELGERLARDYDEVLQDTLERYPRAGALVATGQLQLFCAHPWLRSTDVTAIGWEDRIEVSRQSGVPLITPKIERTVELLREAFASGRKVLVFANFNACGALLREAASSLPPALWGAINGSTPADDRQPVVDRFADHKGPAVLILNPRAAGAGLNITAATVVIHYTQVWNPALELQASARAHRRGQTEPVTIYHMFYVDTVEEVMKDRAQRRRELGAEAVPVSTQDRVDLERALSLSPATS